MSFKVLLSTVKSVIILESVWTQSFNGYRILLKRLLKDRLFPSCIGSQARNRISRVVGSKTPRTSTFTCKNKNQIYHYKHNLFLIKLRFSKYFTCRKCPSCDVVPKLITPTCITALLPPILRALFHIAAVQMLRRFV